jgi:hypothetical protein
LAERMMLLARVIVDKARNSGQGPEELCTEI